MVSTRRNVRSALWMLAATWLALGCNPGLEAFPGYSTTSPSTGGASTGGSSQGGTTTGGTSTGGCAEPCVKECADGTCGADGQCVYVPTPGALCGPGGALMCNAQGECMGCNPAVPESCGPGQKCDDAGICVTLTTQGKPCMNDVECASGACADLVCCDSACSDTCKACNLPNKTGTCSLVPAGQTDAGCSGAFVCDAVGICKPDLGVACTMDTECASGHCADGRCCDTACGSCNVCNLAGQMGTCVPMGQGQYDPECGNWKSCDGAGSCRSALGVDCAQDTECASGHCTDTVCCDTACQGECKSCYQGGICSNISYGTPGKLCGFPSLCSGNGVCLHPQGDQCATSTTCQSNQCVDGLCCNNACPGKCYECNVSNPGTCSPAAAGTNPRSLCVAPGMCNGSGTCVGQANGATCTGSSECASSICSGGYCCDSFCSGPCISCGVPGFEGTCHPVADGTDCGAGMFCNGGSCQ